MSPSSMRYLAIAAALLLAAVIALNLGNDDYAPLEAEAFLPGLKSQINDIATVSVSQGEVHTTLEKSADGWRVREKSAYPADTGQLRAALLALADAQKLEAKTADPERHAQLGLDGDEDSTRLSIEGDGIGIELLIGKVAQQSYRYVRMAGEQQTWLIDQDPDLPAAPSDWLVTDLVNIPASEVATISIQHADGEEILLAANDENDGQFDAANLPEGRELTYASAANGLAAALQGLKLKDVLRDAQVDVDADVVSHYTLADGMQLIVRRYLVDGESWFGFETGADAAEEATDRAAAIAETTAGWRFALPLHKAGLLTKRWEDLLKPLETEDG